MRSLASRRQAMVGVIAGFALSFFNLACLPFCIWGLAALSRDDVRAAFPDESERDLPLGRASPVRLATLAGLVVGLSTLTSVTVILMLQPDGPHGERGAGYGAGPIAAQAGTRARPGERDIDPLVVSDLHNGDVA